MYIIELKLLNSDLLSGQIVDGKLGRFGVRSVVGLAVEPESR